MFTWSMFKCLNIQCSNVMTSSWVYAKIKIKISGTLIVWSESLKIQRGFKDSVWIFNCLVNSFALCVLKLLSFLFFFFFSCGKLSRMLKKAPSKCSKEKKRLGMSSITTFSLEKDLCLALKKMESIFLSHTILLNVIKIEKKPHTSLIL